MVKLPPAFTTVPERLRVCNTPASPDEINEANSVRAEFVIPSVGTPYMEDIVRAFRVANGARTYIEIGTQDKGNISWLARSKLAKGATIIDIDMLDYPDNDSKIAAELSVEFDYHTIRGDCLSDDVLDRVKGILKGRAVDVIFGDSHYTYEHTLTEFSLYYPLLSSNGVMMFHDAEWTGLPGGESEFGKKGKGLAIQQLDRFYPTWMVYGPSRPLYRPIPILSNEPHWGVVAMIPSQ